MTKMDETPQELFEPVRQRRAFEEIVLQIEQAIVEGRLSVGDRLPPEREMADIFHVSRPAVREALRVLEAFGVVTARRGTGAESGSMISAVDETNGLGSLLRMYASLMHIPLWELLEVREALETAACRAVARNASEEDLDLLDDVAKRMRAATTPEDFLELDTEFHVTLARVSGNAAALLLMEALRQAISRGMLRAFETMDDFEGGRKRLVKEHAGLVAILRSRDEEDAARAMAEHIRGFYSRAIKDGARDGDPAPPRP